MRRARGERTLSEREAIARDRPEGSSVFDVANSMNPDMIESTRLRLVRKREALVANRVALIERYGPMIDAIKGDNMITRRNAISAVRKNAGPGQTVTAEAFIEKVDKLGNMELEGAQREIIDFDDQIAQVEYEIEVLEGRQNMMNTNVSKFTIKYWKRLLLIGLVAGIILGAISYGREITSAISGRMDRVSGIAGNLGLDGLYNFWLQDVPWYSALTRGPANLAELNERAQARMAQLATETITKDNVRAVFQPWLEVMFGIKNNPSAAVELREVAGSLINQMSDLIRNADTLKFDVHQIAVVREETLSFVSEAHFYLMNGSLSTSFSDVAAAIKSATGYLPGVIRNYFRSPNYSDLTIKGLMQVGATGALDSWLEALKKLFKVGYMVPLTYFGLIFLVLGHAAHFWAHVTQTNPNLIVLIMNTVTQVGLNIGTLAMPMLDAVAESSQAQLNYNLMGAGAVLSIALYFLPGYGPLTMIKSLLDKVRSKKSEAPPQLPAPQPRQDAPPAALPDADTVVVTPGTDLVTVNVVEAREDMAQQWENAQRADKMDDESSEEDDDGGIVLVPPKKPMNSQIKCVICRAPSELICSHCNQHSYCSKECSALDWYRGKHLQVQYP
jgi:hypothetical protein